jgi:sugar/nucleoside kinase (ribokinase family)
MGNAIVDIIVNIEDEFLEINNLDKGSMNLISSEESQRLLENCQVIKQISGGSSANTVVCLAELGNHVQFIGRVKNDQFGDFFSDDIKKSKTIFNTPPTVEGASTAHSIILITPDAQRTMCTYLGASIEFEPKDIDFSVLKESKYLYLEGYLWDSELAKNAFLKAAQIAKDSNTKIILSLSDSFCVDRHRESFLELIDNYIDIVFCNESEVLSLLKKDKLANCQGELSSLCELVVVTLGSNGSLIINKNVIEVIKSMKTGKVIDTTGAGDIYAGGFIHGLINNYSLKKCGELGSICAGQIITQLGSRSNIDFRELIKEV